jgi:hypothetical protein
MLAHMNPMQQLISSGGNSLFSPVELAFIEALRAQFPNELIDVLAKKNGFFAPTASFGLIQKLRSSRTSQADWRNGAHSFCVILTIGRAIPSRMHGNRRLVR